MVNLHAVGNAKLYVKESQGPTQEFLTNMEISPLPVKGCKFCSAHMDIEQCATPTVTWGIRL